MSVSESLVLYRSLREFLMSPVLIVVGSFSAIVKLLIVPAMSRSSDLALDRVLTRPRNLLGTTDSVVCVVELRLLNWLFGSTVFSSGVVLLAKSSKLELITSILLSSNVGEDTSGSGVVDVVVVVNVRLTVVRERFRIMLSLLGGVAIVLLSVLLRLRLCVLLESNRSFRGDVGASEAASGFSEGLLLVLVRTTSRGGTSSRLLLPLGLKVGCGSCAGLSSAVLPSSGAGGAGNLLPDLIAPSP